MEMTHNPLVIKKQCLLCLLFLFVHLPVNTCAEVTIKYAEGFEIETMGEFSLVTVKRPWTGTKATFTYLLKPRGKATPEKYMHLQVIEVPVQKFIGLSSTQVAFIEQLDVVDQLVGFSDVHTLHSNKIRNAGKNNSIREVGRVGNLQLETILDLDPDIVFTFATGSYRDAHPKLLEAGLNVCIVGSYLESHPLGRAEWLKFFAIFFGKEREAEKIFNALEARYLALTEKTKNLQHRPTVITGSPFSGRWFIAGGNSFVGRFLHDAGGDYIFKETTYTGSRPMDIELVYERGLSSDFWLNPGTWSTLEQVTQSDPRFSTFLSLKNKRLYNNNKRINAEGGNDYWESGIMAPDEILADIMTILHPDLLADHQLKYFTHLQ